MSSWSSCGLIHCANPITHFPSWLDCRAQTGHRQRGVNISFLKTFGDILDKLRNSLKWGSNQTLEKTALATRHQGVAENHRWSALPLGRFDRTTPKYTVTEMPVPRSLWRTTDRPLIDLGQRGRFGTYRRT